MALFDKSHQRSVATVSCVVSVVYLRNDDLEKSFSLVTTDKIIVDQDHVRFPSRQRILADYGLPV